MEQLKIKTQKIQIKSCAFTGHRKLEEDFSPKRLWDLIEACIKEGATDFYNGMAQGFDLLSAEAVLMLKRRYPQIRLIACIPCYNQEKNYSDTDKARYVAVLQKADEKILLSEEYHKGCMFVRNQYMVDNADILIAYSKKEKGGAAYTVKYCQRKYPDKDILYVNV
jgi:uncharacterized phage-like protein YoqJ